MPSGYRIKDSKLILLHLKHEYAGKYKCVAEDIYGNEFVSITHLNVEGLVLLNIFLYFY